MTLTGEASMEMMSSSSSRLTLSTLTLPPDPPGPAILPMVGNLILKLSFVLGGDTGLFWAEGVCQDGVGDTGLAATG